MIYAENATSVWERRLSQSAPPKMAAGSITRKMAFWSGVLAPHNQPPKMAADYLK